MGHVYLVQHLALPKEKIKIQSYRQQIAGYLSGRLYDMETGNFFCLREHFSKAQMAQ